jgi:hypothetical protein
VPMDHQPNLRPPAKRLRSPLQAVRTMSQRPSIGFTAFYIEQVGCQARCLDGHCLPQGPDACMHRAAAAGAKCNMRQRLDPWLQVVPFPIVVDNLGCCAVMSSR